ncbi:MAG: hypothetical protein H7263_05050 [Candidatus Sericytochromatia bacterium]|nr:hypothetical protein [Candidatus Sericytochromatia bacterium]
MSKIDKTKLEKYFKDLKNNLNLIYIDLETIKNLKNENMNTFLYFVFQIKDLISQINNYITVISPELDDKYTTEISEEIFLLKSELENNKINLVGNEKNIKTENNKEISELIQIIEKALEKIKNQQKGLGDKKNNLIKNIEEDKNNINKTDSEIKDLLLQLVNSRNLYLNRKQILEKNLSSDQGITKYLPDLENKMEKRIKVISDELMLLEQDIKTIVIKEQELTDNLIQNPYSF